MAFLSKFVCVIVFLILCLVVIEQASDCVTGYGCVYPLASTTQEVRNRKLLAPFEAKKKTVNGGIVHLLGSSSITGNGGNLVGWELRKVPSGPDPLHHNGGSPKKPQTP